MDVYFYEAFKEEAEILRKLLGNTLSWGSTPKTIQEAGHGAPPARLISIRTQSVVPGNWSDNLEGILARTTGYDHLKKYLTEIKKPLPCGYLEEYATRAVAEQAIMLLLNLLRRLPRQTIQFSTFMRDGLTGAECAGSNLLVVGVGRIGGTIAAIAEGIGMNVQGVDIVRRHPHIAYTGREEGIRWADVVVCAMNLTEENRGYFSYNLLKQGKQGVIFINIARGEHSPVAGLLNLLQEGHLGGVGLDVYENEPDVAVSLRNPRGVQSKEAAIIREMMKHPNVVLTPHNAFNTREALERKAGFTVEQIRHFLEYKDFKLAVKL